MLQKAQLNDKKKQRRFYSGKKKKHTLKTQIIVNKKDETIICTAFSEGRRHDFKMFKESGVHIRTDIEAMTDTGYLGLQKIHKNTLMPKKKSKKSL